MPNRVKSKYNISNIKSSSSVQSPTLHNLRDIEEEKFIQSNVPVNDKYNIVYSVFVLYGIAILLPWNVFINAEDYFIKYKLNTPASYNSTYRINFTIIVGSIGQYTNVLVNIFNILVTFGGNPKKRVPYTLLVSSACVFFHIILANVDSSAWPGKFFGLCCVSVFVMFVATGILNSCVFYVASIFPIEYVNAIILGNNMAGCFTAIASIVSKLFTQTSHSDLYLSATYYFLSALIVLLMSLCGYFVMQRTEFYNYWSRVNIEINKVQAKLNNNNKKKAAIPYGKIIKKIWILLFCIWINFFSTLSIFPVYQLGVEPYRQDFFIGKKWFQDVVTFLTFNFCVLIGNTLPKFTTKVIFFVFTLILVLCI